MGEQIKLESNKPKMELYLPHGDLAEEIFKAYKNEARKYNIRDWDKTNYNPETKQIFGMSHISAGIMNYVGKDFGLSVTVNEDDNFGDVYNLVKGKCYAEFNTLCVAPKKPEYERNNGLWIRAMEIGEEKLGKVKNKFRINGFYYMPDENEKGYSVKIVKAPDFEIIENRDFVREDGVSGFGMTFGSKLISLGVNLADSDGNGRVVFKKSRTENRKFS